jgi:hypothetical protein
MLAREAAHAVNARERISMKYMLILFPS